METESLPKVNLNLFLSHILSDITPSPEERKKEAGLLKDLLEMVGAVAKGANPKAEVMLVGSIAKGTDIAGDKDFDIFIQFPPDVEREELEAKGIMAGRKFFELVGGKSEMSYAEHPYIKGDYKGFVVEIVPCYKIKKGGKIQSAVDRTPLHTDFVLSKIKSKPKLQSDTLLLKKFMKGNNIYGAHAAVEGFSGYLCELLVIKYGSFIKVLDAASKWVHGEHISVEGPVLKKRFSSVPLVFIDPVDETRNVAAAVSIEKMANFMLLAEAFLEKPRKEFFYGEKKGIMSKKEFYKYLSVRGTNLICIYFEAPKLIEDTLIPQLSKSLNALGAAAEREGFSVMKKDFWTDGKKAGLVLEFDVSSLPRAQKKMGPFFDSKVADLKGFVEANRKIAISKPYLEDGHWAIDIERRFRHADDFVKYYLEEKKGFGKCLRETPCKFHLKVNSNIQGIKNTSFWEFMKTF